ncbi:unnamed protein product [Leptosia nina]|uniref:C2H2-type domain-containing protein n=1 Tax=Leptosia nina TaxID=320188 RepID=A0AAV1IXZ5_9NEOP
MIFIAKAQETAKILKLQVKKENCDKPSPALMKTNIKQEPKFYKSMNSVKPEEQNYSPQHSPVPENGTKMVAKAKAAKIQCEICNTVINKSYYSQHMTMHDPNHQKYICDVCGKSFRLRCAYHSHSLRHRSDFQHKCQFCPYKARYKELLKTHMKVHIGDYKYMCTECPTRFLFKSNLNRHLLRHKEPQFSCDVCKRSFHIKLALQRHYEADHLGIKKHVCNICGKAFGYRNAMMKHQRCVHKREKIRFSRMPAYLQTEKNL